MVRKSTHDNCNVTGFRKGRSAATAALMVVLSGGVGMAQPPKSLAVVNAGSGGVVIAPDSIASALGRGIGASTESARSLPLPTTLSGVSVQMTDSLKASVLDPLLYVAPNQINFFVPDSVAIGTATVKILNGDSTPPSITVQVANVAPGLFTANGSRCAGIPGVVWNRYSPSQFARQRERDYRRRQRAGAVRRTAGPVPRTRPGERGLAAELAKARRAGSGSDRGRAGGKYGSRKR